MLPLQYVFGCIIVSFYIFAQGLKTNNVIFFFFDSIYFQEMVKEPKIKFMKKLVLLQLVTGD